ncbi:sigma-54-dependent Fis family transcriptional regulator [Pseudoalteromonas rubra]|uniref:Sigma-54-dependent Fis family transcriptional regulator n=1 Tax=Pseudoalteromonas rubra TaxID=43658 RepID=A0A5S3WPR9_9GAMM|nr:sigma-54 dependent transcriptional regulator [Pseudoalteromonas rubra]TMP27234.1 sigma-54-dependent Fis family transcriptional regulator [Pseudoalteromonas rubra]TMP30768.1 sigma-54-dependent Fis family transcriptional regulator [Pseudoalteromonas rubra]
MSTKRHILIADDDMNVIAGLSFLLQDEGYEVSCVTTAQAALEKVKVQSFDCALLDMNFGKDTTSGQEGLALITELRQLDSHLPIVMTTGWATIELAVDAMRSGAQDFVQKPWDNERLLHTLQTHITLAQSQGLSERLKQQNQLLQQAAHPQARNEIVAYSQAMQQLLIQLEQLAQSDMSILLTGDNGTGKSMLAAYVHRCSARAEQPFVTANMGAIVENLFESEMFGHVRGAFTDAKAARAGRFEMARHGTLFLDEIANIPLSQQAKLLSVLEERKFEAVGSSQSQVADVRVISATNGDLPAQIQAGTFRQDLYYRLNTVELRVPSLRERVEDITPLTEHFLAQFAAKYNKPVPQLSEAAQVALRHYDWPGNIRELRHVLERALFVCRAEQITPDDLAITTREGVVANVDDPNLTLDEIEQAVLRQRLRHHQGNASETARSLGLSRSGYYRRLAKFGLAEHE